MLNEFSESWNHHALSSEGNMTPLQLFFEGAACAGNIASASVSHTDIAIRGDDGVAVPRIVDNGIDIHCTVIQTVGQHLGTQCSNCQS